MFGRGCGPGGRGGGPRGRMMAGPFRHWFGGMRSLLEGIDLSDQQIEQIAELKHSSFSKMGHGRVDMMELRHHLMQELAEANIDRAKLADIKAKMKQHKSDMTDMMIDNMTAFAEILTPEQRKMVKLKKIREFLGSDDHDHDHDHGHDHESHDHPHPPHRPGF